MCKNDALSGLIRSGSIAAPGVNAGTKAHCMLRAIVTATETAGKQR